MSVEDEKIIYSKGVRVDINSLILLLERHNCDGFLYTEGENISLDVYFRDEKEGESKQTSVDMDQTEYIRVINFGYYHEVQIRGDASPEELSCGFIRTPWVQVDEGSGSSSPQDWFAENPDYK